MAASGLTTIARVECVEMVHELEISLAAISMDGMLDGRYADAISNLKKVSSYLLVLCECVLMLR